MNILIIEDEPTNLKLANVVLATEGHKVNGAEAAEHALKIIKRDKPEVILMDLALPGMDGLTLAKKLKEDPETCDIQIIAITAYPDRYSRAEAMKAGCSGYILKPIDTRTFPKQVADIVK